MAKAKPRIPTKLATDFEDDPGPPPANETLPAEQPAPKPEPESGKDADGVPYCKVHHVRMKRVSGGRKGSPTNYYACPVDGCDCRAQMIKTKREQIVPKEPVTCPRCEGVVCERDENLSSFAKVVLRCPSCTWKSNALAVPSFVAAAENSKVHSQYPMLGER